MELKIEVVKIDKPDDVSIIIGQAHFIKTIEDIYEALICAVCGIKFGIAFCEASGEALLRTEASDEDLNNLAIKNALKIKAGHTFVIVMKDAYPINVLNQIKMVPEVCRIFCATANPLEIIIASTDQGRGILGVIDGVSVVGLEKDKEKISRKELLRKIGYKLR